MIKKRQELALRAALCSQPQSIDAWRELRQITEIEDLDHSVTRVLPSVYKNLKETLGGNDLLKLRGSARHTWARNTEFLRQLEPLILELDKESIDYRILKGGAINLLFNPPDFRIMGDIDLLVSKSEIPKVQVAFDKAGFTPKFAIKCPHQMKSRKKLEASFINNKSLEIDLHVAEERSESALFKRMLQLPPQTTLYRNLEIRLPTTELLLIHALVHGSLAVEPEDQAQMILDIELLKPRVNLPRLVRELERLNYGPTFNKYLELRNLAMGTLDETLPKVIQSPRRARLEPVTALRSVLLFSLALIRAIRFRTPRLLHLGKIWKGRNQHRILYLVWLYSGLLRQIEFLITTRLVGFIPKSHPDRKLFPVAIWSNDWRFRVTNKTNEEHLAVWLESQAFKDQSFLVFSNGRLVAVTEQISSGKYQLVLRNPATSNEISLRLPFSGCKECAVKLSDLVISQ